MNLIVSRDGVVLGQFSCESLIEALEGGRLGVADRVDAGSGSVSIECWLQAELLPIDSEETVAAGDDSNEEGVPESARGLCWAAFLWGPIWWLRVRAPRFALPYLVLFLFGRVLLDDLGFGLALAEIANLWGLLDGRRVAWYRGRWDSIEQFNQTNRRWTISGLIAMPVLSFLLLGALAP